MRLSNLALNGYINSEAPPRPDKPESRSAPQIKAALLTGGCDRHYTFGLAMSLIQQGVHLDIVGSNDVDGPEMHETPNLNFLNLRTDQDPTASLPKKVLRIIRYYARLIRYAWDAEPEIFHILWNNKFQFFDRTLLMLYYKARGKHITFTAHNVNDGRRDMHDSLVNRLTLRAQYRLADHIFVHTEKMKKELLEDFGVREDAVTVIPYGINNAVPQTSITPAEARRRLGINEGEKVILFFGNIRPYKGVEYLVAAFRRLIGEHVNYRLIIAGRIFKGAENYWEGIRNTIESLPIQGRVMLKTEFVPDEETELYFKAADVLVLPYTEIFQSGILSLAYSFGLPVVATDVGSFREDIIEGKTGYVCRSRNPEDMAYVLDKYFRSNLFENLNNKRMEITSYAEERYSWQTVARLTRNAYAALKGELPCGSLNVSSSTP